MLEVVSIKFKNRGKSYFFAPNGLCIKSGDKVIVETAKGLEIADCTGGNHFVEETAVVQPLRAVARLATADDLRIAALNKKREAEAFVIGRERIAAHGLEMKLVDVECNFEGSKTTFFFTADGRVDFRELVKDLAGIFRNRIELRQIGVRDEAKMIGGIGICGRPYCCNQFLEDFQPVSTKMAKVQSLSLNPTKISGSCGRLMCCLRYEQAAYEDLVKHVPRPGAFVETKDGYGTAMQVNLLRQTVKVKLDDDRDDTLRVFKSNELAAVPGGRPKEGEPLPSVLHYVPEPEEPEEPEDEWAVPMLVTPEPVRPAENAERLEERKKRSRRGKDGRIGKGERRPEAKEEKKSEPREEKKPEAKEEKKSEPREEARGAKHGRAGEKPHRPGGHGKAAVKPVKAEHRSAEEPKSPKAEEKPKSAHHYPNYHRRFRKPKPNKPE